MFISECMICVRYVQDTHMEEPAGANSVWVAADFYTCEIQQHIWFVFWWYESVQNWPFACVTPFVLCVNQNIQNIISANEVLYRWSVVGLTSINMPGWCHSVANTTHVSIQIIFAACIPQLYLWNTKMDTISRLYSIHLLALSQVGLSVISQLWLYLILIGESTFLINNLVIQWITVKPSRGDESHVNLYDVISCIGDQYSVIHWRPVQCHVEKEMRSRKRGSVPLAKNSRDFPFFPRYRRRYQYVLPCGPSQKFLHKQSTKPSHSPNNL